MWLFALFLFCGTTVAAYCTYSQHFWLDGNNSWQVRAPNLCGTDWHALLRLESTQMRDASSIYWLLALHQYYTAYANVQLIGSAYEMNVSDLMPLDDYYDVGGINLSLATLQDSLQRACHNVSQWGAVAPHNPTLSRALWQLFYFNEGLTAPGSCVDEFDDPFSFADQPDLFVTNFLIYPLNEARVTNLYHVQTLLFVLCGLAYFFLVPALLFYMLLKNNGNRRYSIVNESDLHAEEELDTVEAQKTMRRSLNEFSEIDLDMEYEKV